MPVSTTRPSAASSRCRSAMRSVVAVMVTTAPSRARVRLTAMPMPFGLPAPVTIAILPSRRKRSMGRETIASA